ncbi:IS701 family transposase [Streptomyces apocyni]|uniref:IS701 family transposase n=1 Tax=Streptomyces apocyni TaxID=2654677 RepID=UPI0018D08C6D|nr:transposase [Streptomyces apocyni]
MRVEASFLETIFEGLPRVDQRRWAGVYLEGLLTSQGKKSVRRLAAAGGATEESAVLSLQQFLNASPWAWEPVVEQILRWTERRAAPEAWTVGVVIQPKRGQYSAGAHRRFVPMAGRTVNCQLSLGLFHALGGAADIQIPMDWRLFLPRAWCAEIALRTRARVPEEARYQPPWAQVLDLVDTQTARSASAPPPLIADLRDLDDVDPLLRELACRGHEFLIAVPDTQHVVPLLAAAGNHAPAAPVAARDFPAPAVLQQGRGVSTYGRPAEAVRGNRSRTRLVRPAGGPDAPAARYPLRLFAEGRAPGGRSRTWLTNLLDRPSGELLRLTALADTNRRTLQDLESGFGLTDYEGRSYPGWHHHMTLMSAAYAYSRLDSPRPEHTADWLLPA